MVVTENIKAYMREKSIKLADLADRLDTSAQNISKILNKDDLKVSTLEKIAEALGVPMEFFFKKNPISDARIEEIQSDIRVIKQKLDIK